MRGTIWMKSKVPSRADDTSTVRPRRQARKASTATEPHRMRSMMSALMAQPSDRSGYRRSVRARLPDRQRQRDHDAPDRKIGAHDRQFPSDRAAISDQGPTHDHGD